MCGFFAWGGGGVVVAEFLLDPPTHKKSVTGNRVTLALTPSACAGGERWSLVRNADAWR